MGDREPTYTPPPSFLDEWQDRNVPDKLDSSNGQCFALRVMGDTNVTCSNLVHRTGSTESLMLSFATLFRLQVSTEGCNAYLNAPHVKKMISK